MRKKIIACVIAALCLFVSASPWEGAAATAPEGELPGNGRYIATNSFPRNTVVDIVNIETNKSTRVIVARNLDSPGLLAIVSREAAELIGMRPGSVSRIRMTQPSDPVAYVRFTEGLASGITDYDSGDVITEEKYNEEFVNPSTPPSAVPAVPPAAPPVPPSFAAAPDVGYPAYMLEPEWGGANSKRDIVDLPPYVAPDKKPETPAPVLVDVPEKTAEAVPDAVKEDLEKTAEAEPAEADKTDEGPVKTAESFNEDDYDEVAESVPEDEYFDDDFVKEPDAIAEAEAEAEDEYDDVYYNEPDELVKYPFNFEPTEPRPPTGIYELDPDFIISGISNSAKIETPNKANEPVNPVNTSDLSVQKKLVSGRYYVQLALINTDEYSVESVQNMISRINQHYEPFVYKKDGDKYYRILLRPMNQGESAAVLARFKSIGYKDAWVRLEP